MRRTQDIRNTLSPCWRRRRWWCRTPSSQWPWASWQCSRLVRRCPSRDRRRCRRSQSSCAHLILWDEEIHTQMRQLMRGLACIPLIWHLLNDFGLNHLGTMYKLGRSRKYTPNTLHNPENLQNPEKKRNKSPNVLYFSCVFVCIWESEVYFGVYFGVCWVLDSVRGPHDPNAQKTPLFWWFSGCFFFRASTFSGNSTAGPFALNRIPGFLDFLVPKTLNIHLFCNAPGLDTTKFKSWREDVLRNSEEAGEKSWRRILERV